MAGAGRLPEQATLPCLYFVSAVQVLHNSIHVYRTLVPSMLTLTTPTRSLQTYLGIHHVSIIPQLPLPLALLFPFPSSFPSDLHLDITRNCINILILPGGLLLSAPALAPPLALASVGRFLPL